MKKAILLSAMIFGMSAATFAQDKVAAAQPAATENKNQAEFKFENMEYNYGTIKQGDKVEYTFNFTNTGKEPLIITNAQGSCGCTVPDWPKEPIKKGETGKIKVTFNSAGKMGLQDKTVTITSNAKTNPVVLHIKGNIEAAATEEAPKN
jgi:hypothetical protein